MSRDRIRIIRGDITEETVDAIVNAANSELRPGGGVDGAIRRKAGPRLDAALQELGGCRPGDAKVTEGFDLPARHIIHTVGPIWQGGNRGEEDTLAECYRSIFRIARETGLRTLAIPAISTGAYGFPNHTAAHIALHQAAVALDDDDTIKEIRFVCFDDETARVYERELAFETDSPEVY
jgi:O-acetyl-ADP-ribose deacetylase